MHLRRVLIEGWFELLRRDLNTIGWLGKLHEDALLGGHLRGFLGVCHHLGLLEDHRRRLSLSLSRLSVLEAIIGA